MGLIYALCAAISLAATVLFTFTLMLPVAAVTLSSFFFFVFFIYLHEIHGYLRKLVKQSSKEKFPTDALMDIAADIAWFKDLKAKEIRKQLEQIQRKTM